MDASSSAPQTTPSSQMPDGATQAPWKTVRAFSASKTCSHCAKVFTPASWESESRFDGRRFCGKSCARKAENPMSNDQCRTRMALTLRRIGHKPPVRGGNGKGPTAMEALLLSRLSASWTGNYILKTGKKPVDGYPHHYKIDLVHQTLMIAVEVDGFSHCTFERQAQDRKKEALLRSLGWRVLRLSNAQVAEMCSTCESIPTRRISLLAF